MQVIAEIIVHNMYGNLGLADSHQIAFDGSYGTTVLPQHPRSYLHEKHKLLAKPRPWFKLR
jgi:hypothetical protein